MTAEVALAPIVLDDEAFKKLVDTVRRSVAMPDREWLTLKEAAAWTGLAAITISRAKRAGRLQPKKTAERGGRELYRVRDLRAWIEALDDA